MNKRGERELIMLCVASLRLRLITETRAAVTDTVYKKTLPMQEDMSSTIGTHIFAVVSNTVYDKRR